MVYGRQAVILTYRLVRLIEDNSETLATTLLDKVRTSPLLGEYRNVPESELKERVREIYSHLGEWLLTRKERDIAQRYTEIGERRAAQGVPLSQLVWTITVTKDNLWEFLKHKQTVEDLPGVWGELELLQLLDQFFGRAVYFAAVGYERSQNTKGAVGKSA
jgi:hypothetical protein